MRDYNKEGAMNCPHCGRALRLALVAGEANEKAARPADELDPSSATPPDRSPINTPARPLARKPTSDLRALLTRIDAGRLDDREREFVEQTRERFERYGDKTMMTQKQLAWLRRIADVGTSASRPH
jgi:uncharacterized Zn finger protein (UPF0148 family)